MPITIDLTKIAVDHIHFWFPAIGIGCAITFILGMLHQDYAQEERALNRARFEIVKVVPRPEVSIYDSEERLNRELESYPLLKYEFNPDETDWDKLEQIKERYLNTISEPKENRDSD